MDNTNDISLGGVPGREFRSAFGGFNRRDVVAYIERLASDMAREKEEHEIRVRELNETIDRLRSELDETKKSGGDACAKLEDLRAEYGEHVKAQLKEKDGRIAAFEKRAELDAQLELCSRAACGIAAQRVDVAEKAARYYISAAEKAQLELKELRGELACLKARIASEAASDGPEAKEQPTASDVSACEPDCAAPAEKEPGGKVWADDIFRHLKNE